MKRRKDETKPEIFRPYQKYFEKPSFDKGQRRTLFTIKVGAITQWVRDILAIILMWKLIMAY